MPPISDAPAATAAPASSASSADGTVAPPMDDRIRGDVHLLGELLGQVLRESGDDSLYTDVERLRALTIGAYDSGHPDELAAAEEFVASLNAERAEEGVQPAPEPSRPGTRSRGGAPVAGEVGRDDPAIRYALGQGREHIAPEP